MPASSPVRRPVSTYRVQLNPEFPFGDASRLVPYLARLGITECYCSPILTPRTGSLHGYDVCDHARINPDLGGEEALVQFVAELRQHGMGLIVDFVPNHMSTDPGANRWWRSVLESGPSSPHACFFDIDWHPLKEELRNKVLLPMLGDQYGVSLDAGHLQVCLTRGEFTVQYFDLDLPLNPRSVPVLLRHNLDALGAALGAGHPDLVEFQSILFHLDHLPVYTDTREDEVASRHREIEVARHRLADLLEASPAVRDHVLANVREYNGVPGVSRSFDLLHELLEHQPYRPSSWLTAMHEINYRRFFDVNELAGIRIEDPDVFREVHGLLGSLMARGLIDGVRLDHIDGLFDPSGYLERLSVLAGPRPIYVIVEKILSGDEPLPPSWKVHGTTGYDFANDVNGLFVDAGRSHECLRAYRRFTGRLEEFPDVVYTSKKLVIAASMASELNVLAHALNRISEGDRRFQDFTLNSLQEAMREVVACFPVYRTYFEGDRWGPFSEACVDRAVAESLARNPALEPSTFRFIRDMLLPRRDPDLPEGEYARRLQFAKKFQQYTGPVQAKGVEDTAFYRYVPLLSLNEVGGDPTRFGRSVEDFHRANERRRRDWPLSMLSTSTHDSKRGEDARARISVLSEIPDQWRKAVSRWARANASARATVRGRPAPARSDEYLFYQTLVGTWPAGATGAPTDEFVERMRGYMLKAVKEAKVYTSWIHPTRDYDRAVGDFVERALAGRNSRSFTRLFTPFIERIARLGAVSSLAQLLLKVASPGVPDFYRGTELWDLSLVDPDNRRSVDFEQRARWLDQIEPLLELQADPARRLGAVAEMLEHWPDGRIKLYVTAAALRLRKRWAELFLSGDYLPLEVTGEAAAHVVAFMRRTSDRCVVVVAPRLVATLYGTGTTLTAGRDAWGDTAVRLGDPGASWRWTNTLTGEPVPRQPPDDAGEVRIAEVLANVPATLLAGDR